MSGLADVGEMYGLVQEMATLLGQLETRVDSLKARADMTEEFLTTQQFERILYRVMSIIKRMGLPENLQAAISLMSRAIMTARMLTMSLHFLEMATPYGWFMGFTGIISTSLSAAEITSDTMREIRGH